MKLGQGRLPDDALEGNPLSPRAVSKRWSAFADKVESAMLGFTTFATVMHPCSMPPASPLP